MKLIELIKEYIDNQYSNPRGLFGTYTGEKMVKQHKPETFWTIRLLDLKHNETVLELGCGAGYATKLLLEQSSISLIVGIDISKTVLRSAAIRNRNEIKKGRTKFVENDVSHLNFPEMSFDKVFSIHSVYFWDNLQKSISEIYRVLKQDGMVVLTLSDGKSGVTWEWTNNLIEQRIIPYMLDCGFQNVEILRGQNSREYHIVSVRAKK